MGKTKSYKDLEFKMVEMILLKMVFAW
jgi:hypothetical protein